MDINQTIGSILRMANAGRNPNQIIQLLYQRNPQLNQFLTQLGNMANGQDMKSFVMQLAKQNGVNEQNLAGMTQLFGVKQ